MNILKDFRTRFAPLAIITLLILTAFTPPVTAHENEHSHSNKVVTQYTTTPPVPPNPPLLPMGYRDTARVIPQVIMAGISPSVIDIGDTSFEVLALVRPGVSPLQSVTLGQGANPFFTIGLKHINTLSNGDQFWKVTFAFERGAFGNKSYPIKWGSGPNEFFIRATDVNQQSFHAHQFPLIRFDNAPAQTVSLDTTKDDQLSYNATKRVIPQIIMAGVSPAIVDILDTDFDIVTIVRPGLMPIKNVLLKQGRNPLFSIAMEMKKTLSNGDQIWVANFQFPQGLFGISTLPVVWGAGPGEFNIQVIDTAQQSSFGYPVIQSGNFPAL